MTRFLFKVVTNIWVPLNAPYPCWRAGLLWMIGGTSLSDNNLIHLAWATRRWPSGADPFGYTWLKRLIALVARQGRKGCEGVIGVDALLSPVNPSGSH